MGLDIVLQKSLKHVQLKAPKQEIPLSGNLSPNKAKIGHVVMLETYTPVDNF